MPNWSVSSDNATTTSIQFSWQNLRTLLDQQISHYFVVVKNSYGSSLKEHIVSGNTTSHVFYGLSVYREYRFSVVGVNYSGNAYNSTEISAWTDEGGTLHLIMILALVLGARKNSKTEVANQTNKINNKISESFGCMLRLLSEKYKWLTTSPRNQRKLKSTSLFVLCLLLLLFT